MAGDQRRSARERHGLPEIRSLPANLEVEQSVLGALLLNNDLLAQCADVLDADCFHEQLHRRIYEVASGMIAQGLPANIKTLKTYIADQDLGGMTVGQYLARLAAEAGLPSNIRDYSKILHDLAVRRKVIGLAQDLLDQAYDAPVDLTSKQLVDEAVDRLAVLRADPGEVTDYEDFDSASYRALIAAEKAYKAGGHIVGLSTGLPCLDEALGGLQPTDLIILAGRPGMGKTSLATNIAFNVARSLKERKDAGEKVGVVGVASLEMSSEQLTQRIISEQSGVPCWKIRQGIATEAEMLRFIEARNELRRLPLLIDETGDLTIATLRLRARQLKKRQGLELLIVDYLQLLHGTSKRADNRVQELTEITSGLKAMAKELKVPVIALSQLSRRVEERPDRRPMLADLRESGSIEQDADAVMFVYREAYYLAKERPREDNFEAKAEWERRMRRWNGVAEVLVAKNRHGPEANVVLGFDSAVTRFTNEPPAREPDPDASVLRKDKPPSMPKEATALYGILRSLAMWHGEEPSKEVRAKDKRLQANSRVVPINLAREAYAREHLPPDATPAEIKKKFDATFRHLKDAGLAFWTGSKELGGYVFVPDLTH